MACLGYVTQADGRVDQLTAWPTSTDFACATSVSQLNVYSGFRFFLVHSLGLVSYFLSPVARRDETPSARLPFLLELISCSASLLQTYDWGIALLVELLF